MTRTELCKSLVYSGVQSIRDGVDHSNDTNRKTDMDGNCVGFYAVLIDYDEKTETFGVGYEKRVPAEEVDAVAMFDALQVMAKAVSDLRERIFPRKLKP